MRKTLLTFFLVFPLFVSAAELHLYSARKENLIKPLLDQFSAQTGIQIRLVTGEADTLIKRLQSEGRNTSADMLLTTDVTRLYRAQDLLREIRSDVLDAAVPSPYRDPQGRWYGVSLRHRVFVYHPDRVREEEMSDYLDLAERKWLRRICVRSSNNVYNQSLIADLMSRHGKERIEAWAGDLVSNMARPPKGGDRDQIRAVASGQCDLAIVNDYYLAGMLDSKLAAEKEQASQVRLFWPGQNGQTGGTHVNISGAGITLHAKNPQQAQQLLEFMVSDAAQRWYAEVNHEYPLNSKASSPIQEAWGTFRQHEGSLGEWAPLHREAVLLMDRAGWR